jgi:hypothetical protein
MLQDIIEQAAKLKLKRGKKKSAAKRATARKRA